jgi:hypothetical protein
MSEGVKLIAAMVGLPIVAIAGLIGSETPLYIPSGLMAQAAVETRFSADARAEMARLLHYCRKPPGAFKADAIGVDYHQIDSWRNDAGWLARTHVFCANGSPCVVRATALIAAPRGSAPCGWLQRAG